VISGVCCIRRCLIHNLPYSGNLGVRCVTNKGHSLWPPCIADADIIFLPCGFFYLSLFSSTNLSRRKLDVCHTCTCTWCGLSANLECRSEMCCRRLVRNTGRKKSPTRHHHTTLSDHIFATKAISTIGKKTC